LRLQFYGDNPAPERVGVGDHSGACRRARALRPGPHPRRLRSPRSTKYRGTTRRRRRRVSPARHGRGQQECRLDGARERASRQLRSQQVQGHAERSHGNGPALSGGLGAVSVPWSQLQGRGRERRARTPRTTTSSIGSTCSASGKDVPVATGNLSEGVLAWSTGRSQRSACRIRWGGTSRRDSTAASTIRRRLEGEGALHAGLDARAVPHGRRQGNTPKLVKFQVSRTRCLSDGRDRGSGSGIKSIPRS